MLELKALVYDRAKGCDVMKPFATLDFDRNAHRGTEAAAKEFHKALCAYAEKAGFMTQYIALWNPDETQARGYGNCWMVSWEDGPHEWAINASFQLVGPDWYTEPYHGFDLCFEER